MYSERPLPKIALASKLSVIVGFSAFTAGMAWLSWQLEFHWLYGIPFFIAVPLGWLMFGVRRCPKCGRRLVDRDDIVGDTTKFRVLQRCEHCRIDWDTGLVGDRRYEN